MKPDAYKLIQKCVDDGVASGMARAYKHAENPSRDYIQDKVYEAVMHEICEWFKFDPIKDTGEE
jgi:hypothetical protein